MTKFYYYEFYCSPTSLCTITSVSTGIEISPVGHIIYGTVSLPYCITVWLGCMYYDCATAFYSHFYFLGSIGDLASPSSRGLHRREMHFLFSCENEMARQERSYYDLSVIIANPSLRFSRKPASPIRSFLIVDKKCQCKWWCVATLVLGWEAQKRHESGSRFCREQWRMFLLNRSQLCLLLKFTVNIQFRYQKNPPYTITRKITKPHGAEILWGGR